MGIIVQKFGGKLLKNKESMQEVAKKIIASHSKGNKVVAVISATGNTTDELNEKIEEITKKPILNEVDVVLSSGEQIAVGLLSIMLNDMGYKAISLTGWQAGILTDVNYTNANIQNINKNIIMKYLNKKYIVVIAGFQGINNKNRITTLGRGGSDTTASQLTVALNANICEIYKDTKCIFTADPKLIPTAQKLKNINYEEMIELSKMGAKVLSTKSIEYARNHNLTLEIKSIENDETGTVINNKKSDNSFKLISCTKKKYNKTQDILTFILADDSVDFTQIMNAITNEPYNIQENNRSISVIISNKISDIVLKNIHDKLVF